MKSLWNDKQAETIADDPLALRVYSSQLLGGDPSLVLHGGGNTSVKMAVTNLFGEQEEILYVKGSGWDLATIEAPGFAPVRLKTLLRLAEFPQLSDSDMVKYQRAAMLDPYAPNPSVEAILHAIIPFAFVDHSHADALVTITNTPNSLDKVREIYGPNIMLVPYVMPGFILARKIYEMTQTVDWSTLDGIILMNHGLFTFADSAKESYERHIDIVSRAEAYLAEKTGAYRPAGARAQTAQRDRSASSKVVLDTKKLSVLSELRQAVSKAKGQAVVATLDVSDETVNFASLPNADELATRGLLTPDHVIRTKRVPLVFSDANIGEKVTQYCQDYGTYFNRFADDSLTQLEPSPRWALWKDVGTVSFGTTPKEAGIIDDIRRHTVAAIQMAESLDQWHVLGEKDIFEMEYWELEQAKLRQGGSPPPLTGKISLVTGGYSGIGRACVDELRSQGAVVAVLDINPDIGELSADPGILGIPCDVSDAGAVRHAVAQTVQHFGGLDILILNAGIFPDSQPIAEMDDAMWDKTVAINLTSQQRLLNAAIPYLKRGIDPAIIVIASKNVLAPGSGAAAYSVSKAGLTQLGRVAALELASAGVRVNTVHPNAVFDTALWTPELLQKRADAYGLSIEEYKTNNLLRVEVRSRDVAALACAMAGPLFSRTTGAQVPIDGGNERVI